MVSKFQLISTTTGCSSIFVGISTLLILFILSIITVCRSKFVPKQAQENKVATVNKHLHEEQRIITHETLSIRQAVRNPRINLDPNRYCFGTEYLSGAWIAYTQQSKSFYCCGWDDNDFLSNTTECGLTAWTQQHRSEGLIYQGSNSFNAHVGDRSCSCDRTQGRSNVNSRERYQWQPSHCELMPWNATLFCALLGNQTILLSGDSTMEQIASTLMSMTRSGGCARNIRLARTNDLIHRIKTSPGTRTFAEHVHNYKPSIAIINFGAHIKSIAEFNSTMQSLIATLVGLRSDFPQLKVVWKSMSPGHSGCKNISEPLLVYDTDKFSGDQFNWRLFATFDRISKDMLTSPASTAVASKLPISYINMQPLYYRIDAHSEQDCLHYCLPGALDLFSLILQQMLYNKEL